MDLWEKIHSVCGAILLIATIVFAAMDTDGMATTTEICVIMGALAFWIIWGFRLCARHMPEHGSGWWGS